MKCKGECWKFMAIIDNDRSCQWFFSLSKGGPPLRQLFFLSVLDFGTIFPKLKNISFMMLNVTCPILTKFLRKLFPKQLLSWVKLITFNFIIPPLEAVHILVLYWYKDAAFVLAFFYFIKEAQIVYYLTSFSWAAL